MRMSLNEQCSVSGRKGCKYGDQKLWGGEANAKYTVESMILEGTFGLMVEIPGCSTLCMNPEMDKK